MIKSAPLDEEAIDLDRSIGTSAIGGAFELEVTSQNSDLSNVQMTSIGMRLSSRHTYHPAEVLLLETAGRKIT